MSYVKLANKENFPNAEIFVSKTKTFISKLQNLESKLDNIEFSLEENNTKESKTTIKMIKQYLNTLEQKCENSQIHWLKPIKNNITLIDTKNEIQSLKKYLRSRKWIYHNMRNQAEILNTYWYSKAEAEIIEEIDSCLDSFKEEITQLHSKLV